MWRADEILREIGKSLIFHNQRAPWCSCRPKRTPSPRAAALLMSYTNSEGARDAEERVYVITGTTGSATEVGQAHAGCGEKYDVTIPDERAL